MKAILTLIQLCLLNSIFSQNASISEVHDFPKIFSNDYNSERISHYRPGYNFVDSNYAESFTFFYPIFDVGITEIRVQQDISKIVAVVVVDSLQRVKSGQFFYKNGQLRKETVFEDGQISTVIEKNKRGDTTYVFDGEAKYEEFYKDYNDSVFLIKKSIKTKSTLPTVVYLNLRDSNNFPVTCMNSYSNEVVKKGFFYFPKDTVYHIDFKYDSSFCHEVKTIQFQGGLISKEVISYKKNEFVYSDNFRCERVLRKNTNPKKFGDKDQVPIRH
ncbi:MAG: hypothetical protein P8Q42_11065 [Flavobacteriales bacterium]|nr:hypothetical protein [Flavobacteriales bacterium]